MIGTKPGHVGWFYFCILYVVYNSLSNRPNSQIVECLFMIASSSSVLFESLPNTKHPGLIEQP